MRNPNRLVGVALAVMMFLGLAWWLFQESDSTSHSTQPLAKSLHQVPSASGLLSPLPPATPNLDTSARPRHPAVSSQTRSDAPKLFKDWAQAYGKASEEDREAMLSEGMKLVRERQVRDETDLQFDSLSNETGVDYKASVRNINMFNHANQ